MLAAWWQMRVTAGHRLRKHGHMPWRGTFVPRRNPPPRRPQARVRPAVGVQDQRWALVAVELFLEPFAERRVFATAE